jgi:NADPH-dependent ferric siderophore reductase
VPLPDSGMRHLPTGPDWYARWRALPAEQRNPVRTYTVRAVRPHLCEVDLDIVLHGDVGPASRWAGSVEPGEELALLGPDARYEGDHGGVEFRPRPDVTALLLAGDETAVPAIASIVERLPPGTRGEALLEVAEADDVLDVAVPPAFTVTWLPRRDSRHGSRLGPAVRAAADRLLVDPAPLPEPVDLPELDVDTDVLWEVPDEPAAGRPHVWLAGEAAMIRDLRRYLVAERGLDRRSVAFMGYWRLGRTEDGT